MSRDPSDRTTPVVQKGGVIQVSANGLGTGASVEVIVLAEDEPDRPSISALLDPVFARRRPALSRW